MPGREEEQTTALLISDRSDLSGQLAEVLEGFGYKLRAISSFDQLDTYTDAQPALIVVDFSVQPGEAEWSGLARQFPLSTKWALLELSQSALPGLVAAFKLGCQNFLADPVERQELEKKLAELVPVQGGALGELERHMSNEIKLELPSDVSLIEQVIGLVTHRCRDFRSYGPRTLVSLRIALSEALSNAILYGNAGDRAKSVTLRAKVDAWSIKVQVTDEGSGFDPREVPDPTRPDTIESAGGRGLFLLQQLADEVTYNEQGNSVTLVLRSELQGDAGPTSIASAGDRDFLGDSLAAEIELLHSITETLASVTGLEEAAARILEAVVRFTGARRASLWIHARDELVRAAAVGPAPLPVDRIPVSSGWSISALAFRENRVIRLHEARPPPFDVAGEIGAKPEPWVAVPVVYTSPGGSSRTVGVLNLVGERTGAAVSGAGETRLLMTLARQIGSAIENLRLVEEAVARERLIGELELAQELQMKLLPDVREFQDIADVAALCVPARPVGGDFYQLFKLPEDRIGVMLGDVTSHGFGAALIMALSMGAAGIYAREKLAPGDLLKAVHHELIQKLESTETFMTVFYGVIDPGSVTLSYANAGHAHAFRLHGDEEPQRLAATSLPLGTAEYDSYGEACVPWKHGDVLCLFTDGLTSPSLRTTEEALLAAVHANRDASAREIVDALFEARERQAGTAPDDQTALVLRV